ncbi:hypothetical protein CBS101457_003256 [Exobasidium rhododendri]|nr:hypothetical protein CBS101457_003256 [Exobasidium rhododendri]
MTTPIPSTLAPSALFDLKGRVAVLTGGATGIGLMQARGLHDAGCKVYIVGRRGDVLDNAVESWGFAGKLEADVTKVDEIERIVKEMEEREGKVDIVVANAGKSGPTHHGADTSFPSQSNTPGKGLKQMSPEEYKKEILEKNTFQNWNDLFEINTSHILFMAVSFLPLMAKASEEAKKEKRPHTATFITTGSISGMVKQAQMHYAYNAAKAAANHLTESIAFEFTSTVNAKVRVNAVAPGVFPSEMTGGGRDNKNQSDLSDSLPTMSIPANRPGQAEDMAQTIQFLAACEYMHGQIVVCDGGFTLTEP